MVRGGVGGAAADQPPNVQVSVEEVRFGCERNGGNGAVADLKLPGYPRHPNTSWGFGIWTPQTDLKQLSRASRAKEKEHKHVGTWGISRITRSNIFWTFLKPRSFFSTLLDLNGRRKWLRNNSYNCTCATAETSEKTRHFLQRFVQGLELLDPPTWTNVDPKKGPFRGRKWIIWTQPSWFQGKRLSFSGKSILRN